MNIIFNLPAPQAAAILNTLSREDLIDILSKNDFNGVYSDADSIREFGSPATRDELVESFWRCWDEE